jgi:hypothetical protein
MKLEPKLAQAKQAVIENLEGMLYSLDQCVSQGLVDYGNAYYNEITDLQESAKLIKEWEELLEVVSLAKTIETDLDAWKSLHGQTTISLSWPTGP